MEVLGKSAARRNPCNSPLEWRLAPSPVQYETALAEMDKRVAAIAAGLAPELVWLLEHPPLYTAGRSAKAADLLQPRFPVYQAGRGGEYTYHGPGQRVAYVLLDLNRRGRDLHAHVRRLEDWGLAALARLGISVERREAAGDRRVGLWTRGPDGGDDKIAALGVRVSKWVTSHGIAINLDPDLSHYNGIVPCGIRQHGVTSVKALGNPATLQDLDRALRDSWNDVFG